jgi:hypothetical protein
VSDHIGRRTVLLACVAGGVVTVVPLLLAFWFDNRDAGFRLVEGFPEPAEWLETSNPTPKTRPRWDRWHPDDRTWRFSRG